MSEIAQRINELQELLNIQCSNGNWNYDAYMHGLANGLILAEHTITGKDGEVDYKVAPEQWLCDLPSSEPFTATQETSQ